MPHGRSIRIYLADGSASGIRHAEVVNWTGQAIVCPRTRVAELKGWEESQRPGVYFLMGDDPEGSRPLVYVGEAENVFDRLRQHAKDEKKDFFDQVLLFTSKDANLTKAHVKYLESRIVELVRTVDRVTLYNGNTPPRPALPRPDRDAMEEFLGPARLLMAALGFFALQPLSKGAAASEGSGGIKPTDGPSGPLADHELFYRSKKGVDARGVSVDEGFVVKRGSKGSKVVKAHLGPGWTKLRRELIDAESLRAEGDFLVFMRDVLFASPSAAAAIVAGGQRNGRKVWKDASGATLADLEEGLLGSSEDGA